VKAVIIRALLVFDEHLNRDRWVLLIVCGYRLVFLFANLPFTRFALHLNVMVRFGSLRCSGMNAFVLLAY
jgi:hypothetical protein